MIDEWVIKLLYEMFPELREPNSFVAIVKPHKWPSYGNCRYDSSEKFMKHDSTMEEHDSQ